MASLQRRRSHSSKKHRIQPKGNVSASPATDQVQNGVPAAPSTEKASGPQGFPITLLAAITLGLCLAVISLWQARLVRQLREENARLRQSRIELLSIIRQANQTSDTGEVVGAVDSENDSLARKPRENKDFRLVAPLKTSSLSGGYQVTRGALLKPLVCLTFDGGSTANAAEEILDTLRSRGVNSTMFLTGQFIRKFPSTVLRIVDEGHEVGNHSFTHPHLTSWEQDRTHTTLPGITPALIGAELGQTNDAFRKVTGRDLAPLWRAPYGEVNREIAQWARGHGYVHIGWTQGRTWRENLDSNDWTEDPSLAGYRSPAEVLEKIVTLAQSGPHGINGGIVLLHLGTARKERSEQVHLHVGKLIDTLRTMGYEMVTISHLMRESGIGPQTVTAATRKEEIAPSVQ